MTLGACQEGRESASVTTRDSLGIEIVEYPAASPTVARWRLVEPPEVRIGVVEGDPRYQFVNVVAGLRYDDGRILVLDRSERRVSVFASSGEFIGASGREGRGPGEYVDPITMWRLPGDTLAIYDPSVGRVSLMNPSAEWLRAVSVRPIGTLLLPSGAFADGRLLLVHPFGDLSMYGVADQWTVSAEGLDSIARFRHIENMEPGPFGDMPQPLIHQFRYLSAAREWLFVVRNFGYELEVRDTTGVLRRLVRWHDRDLTMTTEHVEQYKQSLLGAVPERRRPALARSLDDRIINERYPAFGRLLVDRMDRVWLQAWPRRHEEGPVQWTIVDPQGHLEGQIDVPRNYDLLEVGRDYVLAVLTDELDVQFIVVHRIEVVDSTRQP